MHKKSHKHEEKKSAHHSKAKGHGTALKAKMAHDGKAKKHHKSK